MYTVVFSGVVVTLDQDLFDIIPATNKGLLLHALYLNQSSDVGDAEEEQLRIQVIRNHTTVGSGGTAPTPKPARPGDGAASFTARVNDDTLATSGTVDIVHADGFNVRAGYQIIWTPEMRIGCTADEVRLVVRLMADTDDALTMDGTLYVEEL
jgi:hypothetical protein